MILPIIVCACLMIADVRLYACSNSRMAGWIAVKFVVDVMPFEAMPNPKYYFLISCNTNVTDSRSCEVG
jgi:hypothetical protein